MLKSKKILPLLLFMCLSCSLFAQSYITGYYISISGDTIKGGFLQNSYTQMSKKMRFKPQNGEEIVLKPDMVRSVWLKPDKLFESKTIHYRNLSDQLDGTYFLRCLVQTDSVSLYKFECDQYVGLYIQKTGYPIEPLLLLRDYLSEQTEDYKKKKVESIDSVSYSDQIKVYGNVGEYKQRKAYLFTLYQYFGFCNPQIVNSEYQLTTRDMMKAFAEMSKCQGNHEKTRHYFKESSWRPSLGVSIGRQVVSKNFDLKSPINYGAFFYFSDLRDGVGIGIHSMSVKAFEQFKGSIMEFSLLYNRKLFLREKYNFYSIAGIAFLNTYGFDSNATYLGTPQHFNNQRLYTGLLGVGASYQFKKNNYLNFQFLNNIRGLFSELTLLGRLQLQIEHRF